MRVKEFVGELDFIGVWKFLIFNALTFNLFTVVWYERYLDYLKKIFGEVEVIKNFKMFVVFSLGLSYLFLSMASQAYADVINAIVVYGNLLQAKSSLDLGNIASTLSGLLVFVFWVLNIVFSWKMIPLMEEYVRKFNLEVKFTKAWAILFSVFYITYKINEIAQKEEIN